MNKFLLQLSLTLFCVLFFGLRTLHSQVLDHSLPATSPTADESDEEEVPSGEQEGAPEEEDGGTPREREELDPHTGISKRKLLAETEKQSRPKPSPERIIDHEAHIENLLRNLSSPDEETRLRSGMDLVRTAKLTDVPVLVKELKRGNNQDKQLFLIDALAELEDQRAGEALRFEVRHGDIASQRNAVTALGELRYNWPVPVLVQTLRKAEDEELRKRAASALGVIGSTQAEYALRTSLAPLEEMVGAKNAALWALEKIRGEIDEDLIDTKMPKGRRLQLYHKGVRYFFYHPANRRGSAITKVGLRPWLLVCLHDSDLRAEEVFNICWRAGKKRQMAVLTPYFDNIRFPEFGNFNIRGQRADKTLLELIEHVGDIAGLTVREFYLFGYGQGGDFAQRFALAYPKRIAKLAFESDNYTMPDEEAFFPRGVNRSPMADDIAINLYDFIKTETLLILRKNSPTLRNGKEYFEAVTHYADVKGIRPRINVRNVDVKYEIWNEAEKYLFTLD